MNTDETQIKTSVKICVHLWPRTWRSLRLGGSTLPGALAVHILTRLGFRLVQLNFAKFGLINQKSTLNAGCERNLLMKLTIKPLWVMTAMLALATGAGAQTFTVLKTFNPNINATGKHSVGTLAQGPDGTLYGVTTDWRRRRGGCCVPRPDQRDRLYGHQKFFAGECRDGNERGWRDARGRAGSVRQHALRHHVSRRQRRQRHGVQPGHQRKQFHRAQEFFRPGSVPGTNTDGANPAAALIVSNGVLYGTTAIRRHRGERDDIPDEHQRDGFCQSSTISAITATARIRRRGCCCPAARFMERPRTAAIMASGTVFSLSTNGTGFATLHRFQRQRHGWGESLRRVGVVGRPVVRDDAEWRQRMDGIRMTGRCSGLTSMETISPRFTVLLTARDSIPTRSCCFRAARFME